MLDSYSFQSIFGGAIPNGTRYLFIPLTGHPRFDGILTLGRAALHDRLTSRTIVPVSQPFRVP
jgi:hypothetical protein